MQDLVAIPSEDVRTVFTNEGGIDPYLQIVRKEIDAYPVLDMSVKKERAEIKTRVTALNKVKKYIEDAGMDLAREMKKEPKLVDKARKHSKDTLTEWTTEVRLQLTEWEQAEEDRVNAIHRRINAIAALAVFDDMGVYTADEVKGSLDEALSVVVDDSFAELKGYALETKDKAATSLKARLDAAVLCEAEQVELEDLRKAKAIQDEKDRLAAEAKEAEVQAAIVKAVEEAKIKQAADDARVEAQRLVDKAEQDKILAQQREKEAITNAEAARVKAETDAKQAVIDAEQAVKDAQEAAALKLVEAQAAHDQKIIDDRQAQEAADKKRTDNKAHCKRVNNQAAGCFMRVEGITKDLAIEIVKAIVRNEIDNVTIKY